MKNHVAASFVVAALLIASCGDGKSDNAEPSHNTATNASTNNELPPPGFECSGDTISGTAPPHSALRELGIAEIAYTANQVTGESTLEMRDESEAVVATIDIAATPTSLVSSTARLVLRDGDGDVRLTEESRVQLIPGVGSRIETTRTAGGSTVQIWDLITADPTVGAMELAVPTAEFAGSPDPSAERTTPSGEYQVFTVYEPATQEFAPPPDVEAWVAEAGVSAPISGDWEALKAAVYHDNGWREVVFAHLTTCLTGEEVLPSNVRGLQTLTTDDDTRTVHQAEIDLCAQDQEILELQQGISKDLDTFANWTAAAGDATIKGVIIANADKLGVQGTHEIEGFGSFTVTPADLATFVDLVTSLKQGALLPTLSNPVGLLLASVSLAAYLAARVNDIYGDVVIRAWYERQNRLANEGDRPSLLTLLVRVAASLLDPHLQTFDGAVYDFQAQGDFIFARATRGAPLEVHVRMGPVAGNCDDVTYNRAVGTAVGPVRVSALADDPTGTIRVDGELMEVPENRTLFLEGGGLIARPNDTDRIVVAYPSGEALIFSRKSGAWLNLNLSVSQSHREAMQGLVGNFDGDPSDDMRDRNGRVFEEPLDWDTLYGDFRDAWRVSADESLLDYEAGQTPDDFFDPAKPGKPLTVETLPESADVDRARGVCEDAGLENPDLIDDCILDVVCTGDDRVASTHLDMRPPPSTRIDIRRAVPLDDWTVEGPPSGGDWQLAEDGRSVTQLINGQPTFFVSALDYRDVTLSGTIRNDGGDNDNMGLVFGYNGPVSARGDDPNQFDFLLFDWTNGAQPDAGPGFTLSRVDGFVDQFGPFLTQESTPEHQVLATDYGPGRLATRSHDHRFEVSYGTDRLRIAIDDRKVFDLTPADAGLTEFPEGRFGFYNFSQDDVTYADVGVLRGVRDVGLQKYRIDDFSRATDALVLLGNATVDGRALRLTGDGVTGVGNVWHRSKVNVGAGFSTEFTFRLGGQPPLGRGFAFVVQNADDAMSVQGADVALTDGYQYIQHSVAVEFDVVQDAFDPTVPHVSVQTRYDEPNGSDHAYSLGASDGDITPAIDDGETHWARITYEPAGQMQVFVDDPTTPLLTVPVDLTALRLDAGHAYIGFGARTVDPNTFDILRWSFNDPL